MHPAIESLLRIADEDPLPEGARTHLRADPQVDLDLIAGEAGPRARVTLALPQPIHGISADIDCAISIRNMQKMDPPVACGYFDLLRRRGGPRSRFYCVSRREEVLPDGTAGRFDEYPWHADDVVYIDGVCPYYKHFLAPCTLPGGPNLLGVHVPFVNHFDGEHLHRLAQLDGTAGG